MMDLKIGDELKHPVKGIGIVENIEPATDQWGQSIDGYEITINYTNHDRDIFNSKYLNRMERVL